MPQLAVPCHPLPAASVRDIRGARIFFQGCLDKFQEDPVDMLFALTSPQASTNACMPRPLVYSAMALPGYSIACSSTWQECKRLCDSDTRAEQSVGVRGYSVGCTPNLLSVRSGPL